MTSLLASSKTQKNRFKASISLQYLAICMIYVVELHMTYSKTKCSSAISIKFVDEVNNYVMYTISFIATGKCHKIVKFFSILFIRKNTFEVRQRDSTCWHTKTFTSNTSHFLDLVAAKYKPYGHPSLGSAHN